MTTRNYDGAPGINGFVSYPAPPSNGVGSSGIFSSRRGEASLNRHFRKPNDLSSENAKTLFWIEHMATTGRRRNDRVVPNIVIGSVDLAHPMCPNIVPPQEGDDLNVVSPTLSIQNSFNTGFYENGGCVNFPMQGPTATPRGAATEYNPSQTAISTRYLDFIRIRQSRQY